MVIEEGLKFRLSQELLELGRGYFVDINEADFEYIVSNIEDGVATVSWTEEDGLHSVTYRVSEIEDNIDNGDYIVV